MSMKARTEGLLIDALGDELVVYDTQSHAMHRLNESAAAVWRLCDGKRTVSDIAVALSGELSTPLDEDAVLLALDELEAASLLEIGDTPGEGPLISRRSALRKLGVVGGIALGLPLVESVIAPTPAMAFGRGNPSTNNWSPDYEDQDFGGPKLKENNGNNGNNGNDKDKEKDK
jgi:hypothetical protein